MRRISTSTLLLLAVATVPGCERPPSEPLLRPDDVRLLVVSGDEQQGAPGEELPEPLVVRAVDAQGRPLPLVVVNFVVTEGGGSAWGGTASTSPQGYAYEYWTLGDQPGENRMEARLVDPSTGEKLLLHTFVALGVVSSPEVCDGVDNDLDGSVDEDLPYCFNGVPAPNTDGASCEPGFIDLDGDPLNGCEVSTAVNGTYTLDPTLVMNCPFVPAGFGDISIGSVQVTQTHATELLLTVPVSLFAVTPVVSFTVAYDQARMTFGGAAPFLYSQGGLTAVGSIEILGFFTATGVFGGTVNVEVQVDYTGLFAGQCEDLSEDVTGTRS